MDTYPLTNISQYNALPVWDRETINTELNLIPNNHLVSIRLNDSDNSLYDVYHWAMKDLETYLDSGGYWFYVEKDFYVKLLE